MLPSVRIVIGLSSGPSGHVSTDSTLERECAKSLLKKVCHVSHADTNAFFFERSETNLLCSDQISVTRGVGLPRVMDVRNDLCPPTFLTKHRSAVWRVRGLEVTLLSAALSFRPCNKILSWYCGDHLGGISNTVSSSDIQQLEHLLERCRHFHTSKSQNGHVALILELS